MNVNIPLLEAQDIECRVQSLIPSKDKGQSVILLLYKNARVDMRILDQTFGATNWQRTHELINGNLFCSVDIWDNEKQVWVRKQDVGVESNTEKEKGQASDSFKRACTNVGIGRELYTAPFIYIPLMPDEYATNGKGGYKCKTSTRFTVAHIDYNERREISELKIEDSNGKIRYTYPRSQSYQQPPAQEQKKAYAQQDNQNKHQQHNGTQQVANDTISDAQAKRIFAIAEGNREIVRKVMDMTGYEHSKDIKKSDYEDICTTIKSMVAQAKAAKQEYPGFNVDDIEF